jgi:hypothetical protein
LKSGRKAIFSRSRTAGSRLTTSATDVMSLMISFAIRYPGAALPAKRMVLGGGS